MKSRPIIFSGEMVKAILDGRKMQTRRVIKDRDHAPILHCPYGMPGDQLWVKEKWACLETCLEPKKSIPVIYAADRGPRDYHWRSPIFMPRWASRITLEITGVRVAKLHDMNFYDWVADFCPAPLEQERALETFVGLKNMAEMAKTFWDSLNAKRGCGWEVNPFCWVIEFKRIEEGRLP